MSESHLVRCGCGFQWFSIDVAAVANSVILHAKTCLVATPNGKVQILRVSVHAPDPAHHCRENEPRQIPPASRENGLVDECSWNCRGSYSWNCYCPCAGKHHGENHLWDAGDRGEGKRDVNEIMDQIQRAKPRGDWPGRKST
jgi:hypothetical protein